jgi:hypothetical protein
MALVIGAACVAVGLAAASLGLLLWARHRRHRRHKAVFVEVVPVKESSTSAVLSHAQKHSLLHQDSSAVKFFSHSDVVEGKAQAIVSSSGMIVRTKNASRTALKLGNTFQATQFTADCFLDTENPVFFVAGEKHVHTTLPDGADPNSTLAGTRIRREFLPERPRDVSEPSSRPTAFSLAILKNQK